MIDINVSLPPSIWFSVFSGGASTKPVFYHAPVILSEAKDPQQVAQGRLRKAIPVGTTLIFIEHPSNSKGVFPEWGAPKFRWLGSNFKDVARIWFSLQEFQRFEKLNRAIQEVSGCLYEPSYPYANLWLGGRLSIIRKVG